MTTSAPPPAAPAAANPVRAFGRFGLRQLLGKSAGATVWLAFDPRLDAEVMLTVPRVQPVDPAAQEQWQRDVQQAARLVHPNLAAVLEVGVQDHWPYVAVERREGITLVEWLAQNPPPAPADVAGWLTQALEGLAYAHEAGCAHQDLQLHSLVVDEQGRLKVMALSSAGDMNSIEPTHPFGQAAESMPAAGTGHGIAEQRDAAMRDVLCCGLLLHHLLTGQAPLDQADTARVLMRMPPLGREIVHLPWTTPHPVPPALRAIANRSTSGQARQRYLNARTLLRALSGWVLTQSEDKGGPLALLLERLSSVGHLPALPGLEARVRKLTTAEGQHTDAMVAELLQDMAISIELLRQVNSALVRGSQVAGNDEVLTLRRSIALLGLNGIRHAAAGLRKWPGTMAESAAQGLHRLMSRVRLAGYLAGALRPSGYDPEVAYLVTVLQNLGRLLVNYHFPDESQQIVHLMTPGTVAGGGVSVGMSESAASLAVLGVDLQDVGAAVARHWGLGQDLQQMIRRIPPEQRVHAIQNDADALCKTASAANDTIDALTLLPPSRAGRALEAIAQRYARALKFNLRELQDAIKSAREQVRNGGVATTITRADEDAAAPSAVRPADAAGAASATAQVPAPAGASKRAKVSGVPIGGAD